jgi:hypothetical protein
MPIRRLASCAREGTAAGLTPDGGGAAQAAAGSSAGSSATPNRASGHQTLWEKLPKLRGGHEKITWRLGREGGAPEKRIGGEGRAPAGRCGGGRRFGGAGDLRHEELE